MTNLFTNFSLKDLNTFGVEAKARYLIRLANLSDIDELLNSNLLVKEKSLIVGGGSNLLFTSDFQGLIIKPELGEIKVLDEDNDFVYIHAGCGIVWDDLVKYAVNKEWGGIENLSDIPGLTGAAPIQNIGAYGVELKDHLYAVEAIDLKTGDFKKLGVEDCHFGYRKSIFKENYPDRYLVTGVILRLLKKPELVTHYSGLEEKMGCYANWSVATVREAIIQIRREKLPLTDQLGNAGSFFKNPVVDQSTAKMFSEQFSNMPQYPDSDDQVKIPAAWFIQNAGLKGFRKGNVGTHVTQPLVIVNYGGASGKEIKEFSLMVIDKVREEFNIILEPEVRII